MTFNIEKTIATKLFDAGLVDKFYHSVELVADTENVKYPAYAKGQDRYYIGPDDTKGKYAYIRKISTAKILQDNKQRISSCSPVYSATTPYRIVIFCMYAKSGDVDKAFKNLMAVGHMAGVKITAFESDPIALAKNETPQVKHPFSPETLYVALDITVTGLITGQYATCITNCSTLENPICK